MVAYCKRETGALYVTLRRKGETPIQIEAPDGATALIRLVKLIFVHKELKPGDRITVESAD